MEFGITIAHLVGYDLNSVLKFAQIVFKDFIILIFRARAKI